MHTPGKWGICTVNNGQDDDEIVTIIDNCLISIAKVFGQGDYSEARQNGEPEPHYSVSSEESKANASLIAAAPELLNALEMFSNAVDANGGMSEFANIRESVKLARSAINKAKSLDNADIFHDAEGQN